VSLRNKNSLDQVPPEALAAHVAWVKGQKEVVIVREFHTCKQEEGQSVSSHVLKMKGYIDNLERLGQPVGQNLTVSLILVSLNKDFASFVQNFNMHGMRKTVNELHSMLKLHEETLPKKDVNPALHVFQKEVENQLRKTIKSLRSDREGEYMSHEFLDHLKEHGIIAHRTPPYTPQNNRVSKRRNRTLLDMVRPMMSQTTLPKSFWDYALETAAHISTGYPKETMGYSFYNPSENKVFVARNAKFFDNDLIDLKASGSVEDLELIQEEDTNPSIDTSLNHEEDDQEIDEPQSDINPIRRSIRTRHPTDRLCLFIDAEEYELGDLGKPANYKAALLDPESKKWLDAMNVEMHSMKDNDVWVLVELPLNARTVGSKWLFKKKTDMDGAIYIFKARLVAKGFTQTYRVDYEETFSPVADIRAL
ncbi:retrotransposon protein, putative, ty1-copia subclass, partial [Tanacetum coccineum]